MKKAIIFGASGFIGAHLLNELLNDTDYDQVTIVVRKKLDINHPKLKTLTGDYQSLPNLTEQMIADEIFIALGTTKKHTPDKDQYYQVDHDYPVLAAKILKEKGAKSVLVVTAVGANEKSGIFYLKIKGETERDIIALDFKHTSIFRPSMIMGNRKEHRALEKVFIKIWSAIDSIFIGKLNKYKGMNGIDIARAMVSAAKKQSGKLVIYHWKEMNDLL